MRPVLSQEQIRAFDRAWMQRGVPGIVLMENGGAGPPISSVSRLDRAPATKRRESVRT
jgi:hypothetical protein